MRQFLCECVSFHVVDVSVTSENDFDVFELEAETFNRFADPRNSSLVHRLHEDVALGCSDQKRTVCVATDKIDVPDDLVWRKFLVRYISLPTKTSHRGKKHKTDRPFAHSHVASRFGVRHLCPRN